jgi:hypothetical protein
MPPLHRAVLLATTLLVACSPEPPPPAAPTPTAGTGGTSSRPTPPAEPPPPPDAAAPSLDPAPADAAPPPQADPPDGGPLPGPDAAPTDAAPAGVVILPGVRTSLGPDLAPRWVGPRRTILMEGETQVFRGAFAASTFGGGDGNNVRLKIRPGREYLLEYRIRFDGNFPWTRGGKIPGLGGGTAPTGCVTTTGAGFSARMMWRGGGELIGYVYDNDQSTDCGNSLTTGFCTPARQTGLGAPLSFRANTWHRIKERVRMNTGRNRDGILQIWVDDRMVLDASNRAYMNEGPSQRVDVVLFHSFFGGSSAAWAPARDCTISFSDLHVTLVAE